MVPPGAGLVGHHRNPGGSMNTRTIAIVAVVIAVIVLIILLA
jgi:hypothetical protein